MFGRICRTICSNQQINYLWGGAAICFTFVFSHHQVNCSELKRQNRGKVVLTFEGVTFYSFSAQDIISKFQKHQILVTLKGENCERIETAEYSGALLIDLLESCELGPKSKLAARENTKLIEFCSDNGNQVFSSRIPIEKTFSQFGDIILAYEKNGMPISDSDGGPLRVIVPGYASNASVKDCNVITLRQSSSEMASRELPCSCLSPSDGLLPSQDGTAIVQGWALSGGGRSIIRVEASFDKGSTWRQATLQNNGASFNRSWAAVNWNCKIPSGSKHILYRAVDSSLNHSPSMERTFNYLF